ncbi:MAG TPA: hypothetical protein VI546_05580, partial [candidate division Zixibacteria bacterium]|nr:hypothetical protein [candidate division Zixibacteria bacterium]
TNTGCAEKPGDLNHDCLLTLEDIALQMNCVFLGWGDCRLILSDLSCDGVLSPADLVLELNAVFLGSSLPCLVTQ